MFIILDRSVFLSCVLVSSYLISKSLDLISFFNNMKKIYHKSWTKFVIKLLYERHVLHLLDIPEILKRVLLFNLLEIRNQRKLQKSLKQGRIMIMLMNMFNNFQKGTLIIYKVSVSYKLYLELFSSYFASLKILFFYDRNAPSYNTSKEILIVRNRQANF